MVQYELIRKILYLTCNQDAEKAQKGLHGKLALSKKLIVKKAKPQTETVVSLSLVIHVP